MVVGRDSVLDVVEALGRRDYVVGALMVAVVVMVAVLVDLQNTSLVSYVP